MTRTNFERIGGLQKTLSADILSWRQNKMSRNVTAVTLKSKPFAARLDLKLHFRLNKTGSTNTKSSSVFLYNQHFSMMSALPPPV